MLEKIVQIKTIGRFRNYAANSDVTFRKLTLVYAENGRGKTTLCAILRSLQTGQTEFVAERKTLAATDPAFVHIRLNNANYQFTNNAWTETYPDIAIFDPVFVTARRGRWRACGRASSTARSPASWIPMQSLEPRSSSS